jgi:hypothetical protein
MRRAFGEPPRYKEERYPVAWRLVFSMMTLPPAMLAGPLG